VILNPDCVRKVLLTVEAFEFGERMALEQLAGKLTSYTKEELWYTCIKLKEAGYLDVTVANELRAPMPVIVKIKDLTFQGHEFLNSIRDNTNWGKIKNIAKEAGTFSLKFLAEIAQSVGQTAILSALQSRP